MRRKELPTRSVELCRDLRLGKRDGDVRAGWSEIDGGGVPAPFQDRPKPMKNLRSR